MTQELILRAPATFAIDSPAASETARPTLPTHLAVILDGNRRWADRLGLPAVAALSCTWASMSSASMPAKKLKAVL